MTRWNVNTPPFVCLSNGGVFGYGSHIWNRFEDGRKKIIQPWMYFLSTDFIPKQTRGLSFVIPDLMFFFLCRFLLLFFPQQKNWENSNYTICRHWQPNKANLNYILYTLENEHFEPQNWCFVDVFPFPLKGTVNFRGVYIPFVSMMFGCGESTKARWVK